MLLEILTLPLFALSAPALSPLAQARRDLAPPPGMVLVEGGRTKIGSTVKEIEDMGQIDEKVFRVTSVETPQHELQVDDFFLMVNTVTNEQYLTFVRSTGARVPEMWAEKTIDEQQSLILEEEGRKIKEAQEAGRPAPDRQKFVRSEFWRLHGKEFPTEGRHWEMPAAAATRPVVFVDYQAAESYARWAGLRLMTEFEYQRAGRGDDARKYPWGDAFDPTKAATAMTKLAEPMDVGSLPGGATPAGVFELSGNVWEWTSSPFMPYKGYKELKIEVGKGKAAHPIIATVLWDENARVAVGGSFETGEVAARLTTRRNNDRQQSTGSLGFRCASSPVPGLDMAAAVMRQDTPAERRPPDVKFDLAKVTAMDRWKSGAGTSALANYAVIEGYDCVLYIPVVELDVSSALQLDELSHSAGPVTFGILSLTRDAVEPPLPKGTYFVSYLAKGYVAAQAPAVAPGNGMALPAGKAGETSNKQAAERVDVISLPAGFDPKRDNLVFYTPDDKAVASLPVTGLDFTRPKEPAVLIGEGTRTAMQPDQRGDGVPVEVPCDQLILSLNTWVLVSNKGFSYDLVLKFEKGSLGDGWRR